MARRQTAFQVVLAIGLAAAFALGAVRARDEHDRVVLKSGRELRGLLVGESDHRIEFVDDVRGKLTLPRHLVRTVVHGALPPDTFAPLWLDEPQGAAPTSYVRFEPPREGQAGALSTGIARFFHEPTRTTLFLVGAVHVGDPDYYARLQDVLDSSDVVLFEGVGPSAGEAPPAAEEIARFDALFQLQLKLKDLLGLQFQKDGLDYRRPNWTNADVDLGALHAQLEARGAALPTDHPLVRALLHMVLGGIDAAQLDREPRLRAMVKRQAAAALATADQLLGGSMPALNEVLVDWRNDAALAVLDSEVAAGERGRWIALFYGAAHLPDFATKLAARGYEFQSATWLRAWRVE
ncbi:MAG: hypothetical protein EXS13_03720 [Planctomycetes bacterium]|nr:hypothetical protein [Planctomycetota bacterium]